MIGLWAAVLIPLYFTAPADTLGMDASGRARISVNPVHAYLFEQVDPTGAMVMVPGYVDSLGSAILEPHPPGTRETVWLEPGANGSAVTIYVLSLDANGNRSAPSNPCVIGIRTEPPRLAARRASLTTLHVPVVKQSHERCGPAALEMVLRYYGANPAALREADGAYDPVLRGSLITDLAAAARRAGYAASIATLTPDSLIDLLESGVPPILLYQNGIGPLTAGHFGVVTAWDASSASFTLNDGGARPRVAARGELVKNWKTAGSQALIVRMPTP